MVISPRGNYYAFYYGKCDSGNCMKIVSLDSADTLIKNLYMGVNKSTFWTFSNNGKFLGVRCGMDSILIWDMDLFSFYKSFYVHYIVNICFATDSSYLITKGQKESSTTIWNIQNNNEIYNYQDTLISLARLTIANAGNYLFIVDNKTKRFYLYNTHFTPNPVVELNDNDNQAIIYPNPSDKSTKISFSNSEMSMISTLVYDSNGIILKDLGSQIFERGENDINLDCSGLSSGIYFCRMTGKNMNKTFKIIISR